MKLVRLFLWVSLLLLSSIVQATTVKWLVKPDYDRVDFYSENLFKCVKDGKTELYDFTGKTLLPFPVDSVTDYSDGYALLLDKEGKKWRVKGVFGEQFHDCQTVEGTFYTERFTYCSEGFISVADAKGKQGYIDVKGYPVIRCEFREARPFREGWASVSEKEGEAHYIDPYGYTLHVNVKLTDASSFDDNGEALVGNYQKLLILNTSGEVVRSYRMKDGQTEPPVRPYDYVFDEDWRSFKPEHNKKPDLRSSIQSIINEGKCGFVSYGQIVAIPQFDEVETFTDQFAVVRKGLGWGIVGFVDGEFHASVSPSVINIVPRKEIEDFVYELDAPKDLKNLSVLFDCGDGDWRLFQLDALQLQFKPFVGDKANMCNIRAEVFCEDLLLWQDEKTLVVKRAELEIVVGHPFSTSQYANENDMQRTKVVVTNRSSFPVEVSTTIEVVLPLGSQNRVIGKSAPSKELLPDESLDCYVTFKVVEEEQVRVTLSVMNEGRVCGRSEGSITLRPFY